MDDGNHIGQFILKHAIMSISKIIAPVEPVKVFGPANGH